MKILVKIYMSPWQMPSEAIFANPHVCPQDSTSPTLKQTTRVIEKTRGFLHITCFCFANLVFSYHIGTSTCGLFKEKVFLVVSGWHLRSSLAEAFDGTKFGSMKRKNDLPSHGHGVMVIFQP